MDPGIVVDIIIIILFFLQLYTISTLVLVFQCVYYDYIPRRLKYRQINSKHEVQFNFLVPKSIQKVFSYNQPFLTGLLKVCYYFRLKTRKNHWGLISQMIQAFRYLELYQKPLLKESTTICMYLYSIFFLTIYTSLCRKIIQ